MLYTAIGGGFEVGGNCHLVQFADSNILLDCGLRPNTAGPTALPDLDLLHRLTSGRVDALFISHAHRDHAGGVTEFRRRFLTTPVYGSEATANLLDVVSASWGPDASTAEVISARPSHERFAVTGGVDASLSPAGHVVGATTVTLRADEESVVFCADVAVAAHRLTGVFETPDVDTPSVLILGATAGDRLHGARKRMERKLIDGVSDVMQAGGSVVVVSEAFGRSQEILVGFRGAMTSGQAPWFPVRAAPEVARVCDVLGGMLEHLAEPMRRYVENSRRDLFWGDGGPTTPDSRAMTVGSAHAWLDGGAACALVSVSADASSPLTEYAEAIAHDEQSAIFVPDSGDEEALPLAVRDALADGWLPSPDGRLKLTCRVETYDIPMHADQTQLCAIVNSLQPEVAILTHGRPDAIQSLRHKLAGGRPVFTPTNGATFDPLAMDGPRDDDALSPHIEVVDADGVLVMQLGADAVTHPDFRRHFLGYERIEARFDGSRLTLRPTVERDDD